MDGISLSNIIDETSNAYLVRASISGDDTWTCWIPKKILSEDLKLLKGQENLVLIAKKSREHRKLFAPSEIRMLAKYLLPLVV